MLQKKFLKKLELKKKLVSKKLSPLVAIIWKTFYYGLFRKALI